MRAAIAHVDANGMESLTLRSLGDDLGAHFTSLYRHFASKDVLIDAMFNFVVEGIGADLAKAPDEPLERIRAIACSFRKALHSHPALVGTIVSTGGTDSTFAIQRQIIADMQALGVPKRDLAVKYQMLESYVFGASMFDYLGAPEHLSARQARFQAVGIPAFEKASNSIESTDQHNEAAFLLGLDAILATFNSAN